MNPLNPSLLRAQGASRASFILSLLRARREKRAASVLPFLRARGALRRGLGLLIHVGVLAHVRSHCAIAVAGAPGLRRVPGANRASEQGNGVGPSRPTGPSVPPRDSEVDCRQGGYPPRRGSGKLAFGNATCSAYACSMVPVCFDIGAAIRSPVPLRPENVSLRSGIDTARPKFLVSLRPVQGHRQELLETHQGNISA